MNPDTAKIIDRLVTSRDGLRKLDIADYAMIREAREAMSDAANTLTNYAKTFAVIQETDQAAAPHMLPAPEGVSEAKRDVADLIGRIIAARDDFKNRDMFGARYLADVLADAANALSSERERAERAERNVKGYKELNHTIQEYALQDSMRAYRAEFLLALALECARTANNPGLVTSKTLASSETRAQAAEAKVKELLGLLAPFLPINAVDTRDYAELSFGDHQTQAMTMQPDDWIALSDAALRWTETQGEGE